MTGQITILACLASLCFQWSAAQFTPFGFSGIAGRSPVMGGFPGNNFPQQNQNSEFQYVNCMATTLNNDKLVVTLTRPQNTQPMMRQLPWFQQQQPQRDSSQFVRLNAEIQSGQGSQFSGNMHMVLTEYGTMGNGQCNAFSMGNILEGPEDRMPMFNSPWNMMQQNNNRNRKVAGAIGNGFTLLQGTTALMSEHINIDFESLPGSGVAFCRTVNGNMCSFMLQLCCTLAKSNTPASGQNGMTQFDQFGQPQFGGQQQFSGQTQFSGQQQFTGQQQPPVGQSADPFANTQTSSMLFP